MTEQATKTQDNPKSLTIEDLMLVLRVVQVCNSRGAFQPDELTQVGGLYDKLVAFLEAAGAIQKAEQPNAVPNSIQGEVK